MNRGSLPVVAVIPNFNMSAGLSRLLPEVLSRDYDDIYILDDNSTDNSLEVAWQYGNDINIIAGKENYGAGGNRNRIIDALGYKALIHFIDADMELHTSRPADIIRDSLTSEHISFVGGLVREQSGRQMAFNFGPIVGLKTDTTAPMHLAAYQIGARRPALENKIRKILNFALHSWPNASSPQMERYVSWTSESNLAISSDLFQEAGGYDNTLRDHEIQDLAIRLEEKGSKGYFNPLLDATHNSILVRSGNRKQSMMTSEISIVRKHGLSRWLTQKMQ